MQEKEYKYLLSVYQYDNIINAYAWETSKVQLNHYYDTPDLQLYQKNITCRIREKNESLILQVKYPNSTPNNLFCARIEKEFAISEVPPSLLFPEPISGKEIVVFLLGTLETKRKETEVSHGILLMADKSYYLGVVDYELEIEFVDDEVDIHDIVDGFCLDPVNRRGKYTRFVEKYLSSSNHNEVANRKK